MKQNAGGGRIAYGAAGIVPAVLHYYWYFIDKCRRGNGILPLLASAIGYLFGNASSFRAKSDAMRDHSLCVQSLRTPAPGGKRCRNRTEPGLTCDPRSGPVQITPLNGNAGFRCRQCRSAAQQRLAYRT